MKLIVKKLQGGECLVEVQPAMLIADIKYCVAEQLKIPVEHQKLLFLGRTLVDEQTVKSYPAIKDGSKLNLVVKKPEGPSDVLYKNFLKAGMTDMEAKNTTKKLMIAIQNNFFKLSWDDIDRLALDCLEEECLKSQVDIEENM